MQIRYFEKAHGVEYVKVDNYEMEVSILLEIFNDSKSNRINVTDKNRDVINRLRYLDVLLDITDFEKNVMQVLQEGREKERDFLCTGSD